MIWPKTKHVLVYDSEGGVMKAGIGGTIQAKDIFADTPEVREDPQLCI